MKAMFAGFAAIVVIGVGAWFALGEIGLTSEAVQSSKNVRLD